MAQSGAHHHGEMEIKDQKDTFHGFLTASLWLGGQIIMFIALFTLAFAIGAGWFPGLFAFLAIGVGLGLGFKMSSVWWATLVAEAVLLGVGGLVIPALSGMMG
ncbi:hypothetical protein U91I_04234 [alpha proteobacterium U9-1i]|nr:hypothetical protein U91I_04234 [alpha proteobacterium U9-1i]